MDVKSMSRDELESWFLSQLENPGASVRELINVLNGIRNEISKNLAASWAEMLQETLLKRGDGKGGLDTLERRFEWEFISASDFMEKLPGVMGSSPEAEAAIQGALKPGATSKLKPADVLKRMRVLLALQPGCPVEDRTWGFGLIREVDFAAKKLTIDFEKKPGHSMAPEYAAGSLTPLAEDHIWVCKIRAPEEMQRLLKENPADIVRMALSSFGPMTVPVLQARLTAVLIPATHWKSFWEAARKALKAEKDPAKMVDIPVRRSDPIRLLGETVRFGKAWFDELAVNRDMGQILEKLELLADEPGAKDKLDDEQRKIVNNRLAFVLKGAGWRLLDIRGRAILLARAFACPPDVFDFTTAKDAWLKEDAIDQIHALPARRLQDFLDLMYDGGKQAALERLMEWLPRFYMSALNEVMRFLGKNVFEKDLARRMQGMVGQRLATVEQLCWIARNTEVIDKWELGSPSVLVEQMLAEMERDYNGEHLRAQNQLRDLFVSEPWLDVSFKPLDEDHRRDLFAKVCRSSAWEGLDRNSVLAKLIKSYPELDGVQQAVEAGAISMRRKLTSIRTYQERQEQFKKIIEIEIPAAARAIEHARSYGDLRENFEYKSAKDHQGLLLRRRAELENQLARVRPSDFEGFPHDRAGMGAMVTLKFDDGREQVYAILGEWDRDEALNIISCGSGLARALEGLTSGQRAKIQDGHGGEHEVLLEKVTPLTDAIKAWIKGV